jgi:hypothetical protein
VATPHALVRPAECESTASDKSKKDLQKQ